MTNESKPFPKIGRVLTHKEIHRLAFKLADDVSDALIEHPSMKTLDPYAQNLVIQEALVLMCSDMIPSSISALIEQPPPPPDYDTQHFSLLLFQNWCLALCRHEQVSVASIIERTTRQFAVEQQQLSPFGEKLLKFVESVKLGAH